ncbi:MAG TPA: hypothetical protein VE398_09895 [Acidobacteriota bacterium]|nr:hypothetical protein [Acidobacteriota bacterium]
MLFLLMSVISIPVFGQMPAIGFIEFYGLRHVSAERVRQELQIKAGDSLPDSAKPRLEAEAQKRLEAIPGVLHARLELVCCEAGKTILYVGIEENDSPALRYRASPRGAVRLPAEIVSAGEDFNNAFMEAVYKGDAAEDDSQGHALGHSPAVRAIEERFIALAVRNLASLHDVLRNSAEAGQRALAAHVIAYAPDKRFVAAELERAMLDPDSSVRNNAMRALYVIAGYARNHPELKIEIDPRRFVKFLNSLVWTDRNKSGAALSALTEQRDPVLLSDLRDHALASLIEMARWKTGHSYAARLILGRIAGLTENEINEAVDRGNTAAIIAVALKAASGK